MLLQTPEYNMLLCLTKEKPKAPGWWLNWTNMIFFPCIMYEHFTLYTKEDVMWNRVHIIVIVTPRYS